MPIKTIGIVGGMGPRAGIDLADKIIKNTLADSDQQHIPMLLISYPHKITDRTEFLQSKQPQNPAYAICQLIQQLESWGASIIGLPCNTANSPPIMNVISQQLIENKSKVILVEMLKVTAEFITRHFPNTQQVGFLATLGTYQHSNYRAVFSQFGFVTVIPDDGVKQSIHQAIYHPQYGLKSELPLNSDQAKRMLNEACDHLMSLGAEIIVLGCTEIPLVLTEQYYKDIPLIDSTNILARKLIELADCTKLKPYL